MNKDIPLTIKLGEMSLPLKDFANLKPGSEINCKLPEEIEALLCLHNQAFAAVTIRFKGAELQIKLNSYAGIIENLKKQTTYSENQRIVNEHFQEK